MKSHQPSLECKIWRDDILYDIDFAFYELSGYHFAKHFHDHFVIELVVQGIDSYYCNGNYYRAIPNEIALINPGEIHTGNTIGDAHLKYFSLYPDLPALQRVAALLDFCLPGDFSFHQSLSVDARLAGKFRDVLNSFQRDADPLLRQEIFLAFMHVLLQQHLKTPLRMAGKDPRAALLVDYIQSHYKEPITLQELSSAVNLNPFYTVRMFKKAMGMTPYGYLIMTRAEKAKRLLRKGYKVEDAALEAGFYDSSHFYRVFRKMCGVSPISYRLCKGQYRTGFMA